MGIKYLSMNNRFLAILMFALFAFLPAIAQEQTESKPTATEKGWFVGVQVGMPFGVSTFSSFGADKTRIGYSAGLYGDYRFNPVLSLEATAKWGEVNLSAKDCCIDRHLWLGSDGVRYNAPVLDMDGWGYENLKSNVFIQHYGLQLNVNVLGFFNATKHSRWTLEVSPLLAAVGTKATVSAISDGAEAIKGNTKWHLGAGGNLQAGFQATEHLNIGIYSGITYLTGKALDGMPEYRHEANYVWESGIKIGFKFGKGRKSRMSSASAVVTPVVETTVVEPEVTVCPEETAPATEIREEKPVVVEKPVQTDQPIVQVKVNISLPTIYFAFNSTAIAENELAKLQEIKKQMEANPEMKITVNGWCDTMGSKAVNDRISLKRAETVKNWLVSNGIAAERITVKGNGSDFNELDATKARRVESVTIKCEEK